MHGFASRAASGRSCVQPCPEAAAATQRAAQSVYVQLINSITLQLLLVLSKSKSADLLHQPRAEHNSSDYGRAIRLTRRNILIVKGVDSHIVWSATVCPLTAPAARQPRDQQRVRWQQ